MADTKIVTLEVQSNLEQSAKSVGSLKAQLRQAQAEVAALSDKFGDTSREAIEAAKRAAELKDRIGDAKALTEAFNPDAKFKAVSASLSGVAGGFSAVTGAMGLLGAESEDVEKMILKVQSAMAISQGIQAVGESIDSFKQLGAVIKSATVFQKLNSAATTVAATVQRLFTGAVNTTAVSFNALKAAIVSTGIGALVVGLGFLISKLMASSDATKELTDKQKALNQELEYSKELADDNAKTIDYNTKIAIASAKERGASEKELLRIQLDALEKKGKANAAEYEKIKKSQDNEINLTKEQNKRLQEIREENINLQREGNLLVAELEATSAEKSRQQAQKVNDDLLQKKKDHNKKIKEERQRAAEEEYKENQDRIRRFGEAAMEEEAKSFNAIKDAKKANEDSLKTEQQLAIDEENAAYKLKYDTAVKFGQSTEELEIQHLNRINDINLAAQQKAYDDKKAADDKQLERDKIVADAKVEIQLQALDAASGLIGLAKNLGEESKGIQKAALIAENAVGIAKIIINTNQANLLALANPANEATFGAYGATKIAMNWTTAGISIASSIAATAKGLSALGGGGGGASSGGVSTTSAPSAASAPSFNVVGNGGVNQVAQVMNKQGMPPIKTYVTAGDVTSAQSLNRNIVSNATLG